MKLYRIFSKPPWPFRGSAWMRPGQFRYHSAPNSRQAVIIPILVAQYGSLKAKFKAMRTVGPYMKTLIGEAYRSYSRLGKLTNKGPKPMNPEVLREAEDYARSLGIAHIGYTLVKPEFIFRGFEIRFPNAMVLTMEMEHDAMRHNPSDAASKEIFRTYTALGVVVNKLADFFAERGYEAQASPAIGGDVMTVPLAQEAGIGVVGKHGLLIVPEYGPSIRLAAVFLNATDLPLTTLASNPHQWIRDFCETCNHCVHSCPGKAIFEQTKVLDDGFPLYIDKEKCAPEFSKNCSRCISTCPFFFGHYESIKHTYEKHLGHVV